MAREHRAPSAAAAPNSNGLALAPVEPMPEDPQVRIAAIQRARLLRAVGEACAEHGAANLTVGQIVGLSGVSRRTFYENFPGREECLLAAVEEGLGRLGERVLPAYRAPGRWLERMRGAVLGVLEFFDEEPHVARLIVVDTLGSGTRVLRRRQEVLAEVLAAVDEARAQPGRGAAGPPPLTAESAVGGALAVLHARLLDPEHGPLVELAGELTSMLVLPYLGVSAARRELARPAPRPVVRRPPPPEDPLSGLDMRLTYRTVRVLSAVAGTPRASNRELAIAAGIHDQGQASKLLMRLERLGLVENEGAGVRHGAPNAWVLTATGARVQGAIDAQDTIAREASVRRAREASVRRAPALRCG